MNILALQQKDSWQYPLASGDGRNHWRVSVPFPLDLNGPNHEYRRSVANIGNLRSTNQLPLLRHVRFPRPLHSELHHQMHIFPFESPDSGQFIRTGFTQLS